MQAADGVGRKGRAVGRDDNVLEACNAASANTKMSWRLCENVCRPNGRGGKSATSGRSSEKLRATFHCHSLSMPGDGVHAARVGRRTQVPFQIDTFSPPINWIVYQTICGLFAGKWLTLCQAYAGYKDLPNACTYPIILLVPRERRFHSHRQRARSATEQSAK